MKFRIRRTSLWDEDQAPVEGAERESEHVWTIEIPDLAALLSFTAKHGNLVVHDGDGRLPAIEIYDDWRE